MSTDIYAEVLVPDEGEIVVTPRGPVERAGVLGAIVYDFACHPRPFGRYLAHQTADGGISWTNISLELVPSL